LVKDSESDLAERFEEKDLSLVLRLKELDLEIDNYEIVGGFAIYKGKQKKIMQKSEKLL